jgi:hypothetical protein
MLSNKAKEVLRAEVPNEHQIVLAKFLVERRRQLGTVRDSVLEEIANYKK